MSEPPFEMGPKWPPKVTFFQNGITQASQRLRQFAEDHGGRCHYCGVDVLLDASDPPRQATRDHFVPRSISLASRRDKRVRMLLACKRCNELRGHADAAAFRRLMQGEAVTKDELWPHLFGEEIP